MREVCQTRQGSNAHYLVIALRAGRMTREFGLLVECPSVIHQLLKLLSFAQLEEQLPGIPGLVDSKRLWWSQNDVLTME